MMAHQPPFANEQTNKVTLNATDNGAPPCIQAGSCFTLAEGFPAPDATGNYALDPHYPMPYVQVWTWMCRRRCRGVWC